MLEPALCAWESCPYGKPPSASRRVAGTWVRPPVSLADYNPNVAHGSAPLIAIPL